MQKGIQGKIRSGAANRHINVIWSSNLVGNKVLKSD